jgi:hypothetical protein
MTIEQKRHQWRVRAARKREKLTIEQKEKIKQYMKEYGKEYRKEYNQRPERKNANRIRALKYRETRNEEQKKRDTEIIKKYWLENKERLSIENARRSKIWNKDNPDKYKLIRERYYNKNKKDINHRIRWSLRARINAAIKKNTKSDNTINLIGCSIEFLRGYLESRFQIGMTWENYGFYGWHIDHIKPCASFDLTDKEQQKICFHYTNLQPLWAIDNIKKRDKIA